LALLDMNGDGRPDLVVGDTLESVYLLGNGDGTFQTQRYFSSGPHVEAFAVASWNNDGVPGLAISQKSTVMAMDSALNPKLYSSAPTLSITSTHTGNFTHGQQNATYTITVSNAANAAPVSGGDHCYFSFEFAHGLILFPVLLSWRLLVRRALARRASGSRIRQIWTPNAASW
jgi:hypothetical protein